MTESISSITVDSDSIHRESPQIQHEMRVAITDILHDNSFSLSENPGGPYHVVLKTEEGRLVFEVTAEPTGKMHKIVFSTQALKKHVRDYFLMCESYYAALKEAKPHKLESIDMGRRGMHNDAAEELKDLLEGKIQVDFPTARRLFTLISVLYMK